MSATTCSVFIASSVDGFIAKPDGSTDWLHHPSYTLEGEDFGYEKFMNSIDALIMGRKTYETVLGFDTWLYTKPVVVLSSSDIDIPDHLTDKVSAMSGEPDEVIERLQSKGWTSFYIDGGVTISDYLSHGKINTMIITLIPVLLGEGIPLFPSIKKLTHLELLGSTSFPNGFVQNTYAIRS